MAAAASSRSKGRLFFLLSLLCLVGLASSRKDDMNLVSKLLLNFPLLWKHILQLFWVNTSKPTVELFLLFSICTRRYAGVVMFRPLFPPNNDMLILTLDLQDNFKAQIQKAEENLNQLKVSQLVHFFVARQKFGWNNFNPFTSDFMHCRGHDIMWWRSKLRRSHVVNLF